MFVGTVVGVLGGPLDGDPVGFLFGSLVVLLVGEEIGLTVCPFVGEINGGIVLGLGAEGLGSLWLDGAIWIGVAGEGLGALAGCTIGSPEGGMTSILVGVRVWEFVGSFVGESAGFVVEVIGSGATDTFGDLIFDGDRVA
jgi:hypothetical protein